MGELIIQNIWIFSHYAAPPTYTGALRHYNIANFLRKRGYKVTIFASSAIHNTNINLAENNLEFSEKELDGVRFVFIKTRNYTGLGFKRVVNMLEFCWGLFHTARHFKSPDLIFAASPTPITCLVGFYYAKKFNIPCSIDVLDLWPESIVDFLHKSRWNPIILALRFLEKYIYKKADSIVFSIEGGGEYIYDMGWGQIIDSSKIYSVNLGIDLDKHDADLAQNHLDLPMLLRKDIFKVIYCGSIRTMNNVELLVDAAKMIQQAGYSDIQLLIYGDGEQLENLRHKCINESIKNVYFGGRIAKSDLPYLLSCADLNVLIYADVPIWRYGGSQSKLFDYLASGKPILTNIHMGYSLLERYNCGMVVKNKASDGIAEGILEFYRMLAEERDRMGQNARRAAEDYDQPILVDKLIKVFESTTR